MGQDAAKPARQTWREWVPPGTPDGELLTREEVLADIELNGITASDRDLRYWEAQGVLPTPVRRSHKGKVRALYPIWYTVLVGRLRYLQRRGLALADIAQELRGLARFFAVGMGWPTDEHGIAYAPAWTGTPLPVIWPLRDDLVPLADELVRQEEAQGLGPFARVEVRLVTASGDTVIYYRQMPPSDSLSSAGPENLDSPEGEGYTGASERTEASTHLGTRRTDGSDDGAAGVGD